MTESHATLPAPPREVTPHVRRAAWGHPQVRFWWLVATALGLCAAYLAAMQVMEWSRERRLIQSGKPVDATVYETGVRLKDKPIPPLSDADLLYTYDNKHYEVTGPLNNRPKDRTLMNGDTIRIKVDPDDPQLWTDRTEPGPLLSRMTAPAMLLAVGILAWLISLLARNRVQSIYVRGEPRDALAADVKQSPLAPTGRIVRCAIVGGPDKRLLQVYLPARAGKCSKGDTLAILIDPSNPQRAVATRAFSDA